MLGHLRSQHMAKLQIFTCWSLSTPIVGAVHGEDVVRSILFGHWMAHFSATLAVAGSGDTIRFGSLEFPALPPVGMWFHPSSNHPRPSSSEAWTSSPTGSAYYTSARGHLFWRPLEGRPPSALGHTTTSMMRRLRFILSKLSAQILL